MTSEITVPPNHKKGAKLRCRMPNGAVHTVLVPPGASSSAANRARLSFKVKNRRFGRPHWAPARAQDVVVLPAPAPAPAPAPIAEGMEGAASELAMTGSITLAADAASDEPPMTAAEARRLAAEEEANPNQVDPSLTWKEAERWPLEQILPLMGAKLELWWAGKP